MKKKLSIIASTVLLALNITGCGLFNQATEIPDNYTYVNTSVDYEYFYNRDEDRDKIAREDISAALVAAVLSGVFEDNYIDISTFKIKDMTDGFSLYSGNFRDNPSAKISLIIEVKAISKEDYDNKKYTPYILTKYIDLAITYGQWWKSGTPVGSFSYINLDDYDGGFEGLKKGINEGIKNGWYNRFATAEQLDRDKITSKFYEVYNEYQESHSSSNISSDVDNAEIKPGWYDAYCSVLSDYQEELPDAYMYREYYLPDINRDGIPELVIYQGKNIKDAENIVYTYKEDTIFMCGTSGGTIHISGEDEAKIKRVSEEAENIISEEGSTTYVSFCFNGYQRTAYFKMTMDYKLEMADYYDSGKEKLSEYKIPGTPLGSCDISSTELLDKFISGDKTFNQKKIPPIEKISEKIETIESQKETGATLQYPADNNSVGYQEETTTQSVQSENDNLPENYLYLIPEFDVAAASSQLSPVYVDGKTYTYDASNVFDGSLSTCWCEGANDSGENECLIVYADSKQVLNELAIYNGLCEDEELFYKNCRIKDCKIEFSDGTFIERTLDGDYANQPCEIKLDGYVYTDYVKITILSTYSGNKYSDTCISEIEFRNVS